MPQSSQIKAFKAKIKDLGYIVNISNNRLYFNVKGDKLIQRFIEFENPDNTNYYYLYTDCKLHVYINEPYSLAKKKRLIAAEWNRLIVIFFKEKMMSENLAIKLNLIKDYRKQDKQGEDLSGYGFDFLKEIKKKEIDEAREGFNHDYKINKPHKKNTFKNNKEYFDYIKSRLSEFLESYLFKTFTTVELKLLNMSINDDPKNTLRNLFEAVKELKSFMYRFLCRKIKNYEVMKNKKNGLPPSAIFDCTITSKETIVKIIDKELKEYVIDDNIKKMILDIKNADEEIT